MSRIVSEQPVDVADDAKSPNGVPLPPSEFVPPAVLSAQDYARFIPLLKEYSDKYARLVADLAHAAEKVGAIARSSSSRATLSEVAWLLSCYATLEKPVANLARWASGMIEQSALEMERKRELKLRLDELEEHLRFGRIVREELVQYLTEKNLLDLVRQFIIKSGRGRSPV